MILLLSQAISERFRDEVLYNKALYKSILLYFNFAVVTAVTVVVMSGADDGVLRRLCQSVILRSTHLESVYIIFLSFHQHIELIDCI